MTIRLFSLITAFALLGCANTTSSKASSDTPSGADGGDAGDGTTAADGSDGSVASDGSDGNDGTDGNDGADGNDGGPADPAPKVIACTPPTPATSPGANGCSVESGSSTWLIVGDILTPSAVYTGGSVVVGADGRIACVGCDCAADGATRIICPDAVVSPGLINAHDHLGWMNATPWFAADEGVDPALRWEHRHDWRKGKRNNPKITTTGGGASMDEKAFRELGFALGGATGVFGSGDTSGILRDLDRTGSGDNGLGKPGAEYQTFPLGDSGGTLAASGCSYKPVSGESGTFVPHVSEGIDPEAHNEFVCLTGQGAGSVDILNGQTAIVHGVGLSAQDVSLMASRGIKLVWSPRSNVSLYGETARVTLMHAMGIGIALGTDWVPSGSVTMLRELQCADYLNSHHFGGYFRDDQIWRMATLGSAAALGVDDVVGVLAAGYVADIAVFAKSGHDAYRAVIDASVGDTLLVLQGGKVVVGEAAVVGALESGCDSLGDVCGHEKSACTQRFAKKSWSALKAAVTPAYPLFFCGMPDKEPTCVPTRTLPSDSIAGSTLYAMSSADDPDGDGIPTADDNCPDIFNPIRPLDGGKQADADQDQAGDECDPCPLDANTSTCSKANPNDPDNDGVPVPNDNCPTVANPDQADADGDLKGDACDDCKDYANPGANGCLATIPDIKTLTAYQDRVVALDSVVVTALAGNGYWVQADATSPADHGGIFVYTGGAPAVHTGDELHIVAATVGTHFDQIQLSEATVETKGSGKSVTPVPVAPGDLAAQVAAKGQASLEGVLVNVQGIAVTNATPTLGPGTTDDTEYELTGGVHLDDGIWPTGTPFIDPPPKTGDVLASVTGVLSWRNENLKLLPRGTEDLVLGPPALAGFGPDAQSQLAGKSGNTFPKPLTVTLNHASEAPFDVTLSTDDPNVATVPSKVTIAAGQLSAVVPVTGVGEGVATLTAAANGISFLVDVTIYPANAVGTPVELAPSSQTALVGTEVELTVWLNLPAGAEGLALDITVTGGAGTAPAFVTVPEGEFSATFVFTAGDKAGSATVEVSDGTNTVSATIEVVPASAAKLDLGGWKVVQTAADKSFTIPDGTSISGGGYLIIARDANKAAFETYWGVTLGPDVVFLQSTDTGAEFPSINGDETFALVDSSGKTVDGPSIALAVKKAYNRKVPVSGAGAPDAWSVGDAKTTATPGTGQALSSTLSGVYISEYSDSDGGSGTFANEFVEIHFDGKK